MVVTSQGFNQTTLGHDDERDAVGQSPGLVGATLIEVNTTAEKRPACRNDLRAGVGSEQCKQPGKAGSLRRIAERISDLGENPFGGHNAIPAQL